jgi:hypothetical protein
MDVREWLKRSDVFVVEMSQAALRNMMEEPESEMPKSFGDACDAANASVDQNENEAFVVIRVKYEPSE